VEGFPAADSSSRQLFFLSLLEGINILGADSGSERKLIAANSQRYRLEKPGAFDLL